MCQICLLMQEQGQAPSRDGRDSIALLMGNPGEGPSAKGNRQHWGKQLTPSEPQFSLLHDGVHLPRALLGTPRILAHLTDFQEESPPSRRRGFKLTPFHRPGTAPWATGTVHTTLSSPWGNQLLFLYQEQMTPQKKLSFQKGNCPPWQV